MNDIELELREMLDRRSREVEVGPQMRSTVRRARVRRATNSGVAMLSVVALVAAGAIGVRELTRSEVNESSELRPAFTTEGEFGFTSVEGAYPRVASGTFRGADWEMTVTNFQKHDVDMLRLALSVTEDGRTVTDEVEVGASDDFLMNRHVDGAEELLDGAHVVYGMIISSIDSVEVEVSDGSGSTITPHIFRDYDEHSEMSADYYLAFVPDAPGFVAARDPLGIDRDLEAYGRVSLAPHVVVTGRVPETGANWGLEFGAVEEDRVCLVFAPVEGGSECLTRDQVEGSGPMLMVTIEVGDTLGVIAIISDEVSHVRLMRDGKDPAILPWFQPPNEDLGDWPLRLVAVGLPAGAHGMLQAVGGDGETKIAEERF